MSQSKLLKRFAQLLICSAGLTSGLAMATPQSCNPAKETIGNASTSDVYLTVGSNQVFASGIDLSPCVNPVSGSTGDSSGFANANGFGTGWTYFGKIDSLQGHAGSTSALNFNINFAETTKSGSDYTGGTWSIQNTNATSKTLDLVFDIHAGDGSMAFFFDNLVVAANTTLSGDWAIKWYNSGSQVPGFSNAAFFDRDVIDTPTTPPGGGGNAPPPNPIPEPGSLALMGLGMLGATSLRKRNKAR